MRLHMILTAALVSVCAPTALAQLQVQATTSPQVIFDVGDPSSTMAPLRVTTTLPAGTVLPTMQRVVLPVDPNNFAELNVGPAVAPAGSLPVVPGQPGVKISGLVSVRGSGVPFSVRSSALSGGVRVELSSATILTGELRLGVEGIGVSLDIGGDDIDELTGDPAQTLTFPVLLNPVPVTVDADFSTIAIDFSGSGVVSQDFTMLMQFVPGPVAYPTIGSPCGASLEAELEAVQGQAPLITLLGTTSRPVSTVAFVFGTSLTNLPLPTAGCVLGVDPLATVVTPLIVGGQAGAQLTVPPGVTGAELLGQFVTLASGPVLDFQTSEVARITLP
ncbi:MAG: hypothetical protein AAF196_01265 [Planctomycetota bacterium]